MDLSIVEISLRSSSNWLNLRCTERSDKVRTSVHSIVVRSISMDNDVDLSFDFLRDFEFIVSMVLGL